MSKISNFFQDVRVELSKVTWPTASKVAENTVTVIAMSLVVALFLGVLDFGFREILKFVI